ncbi:MAG: CDP-glucose 4,6-dehydratase [Elusimicrobia bacterium]|nr:CDP-glucose 4,6-dehydratase [Elusimicrobiota bacterium]
MRAAFGGAFSGRVVLVTGHTGFKGAWLALWLRELGAKVVGCALPPDAESGLFERAGLGRLIDSRLGDVRDPAFLKGILDEARPEIVFHLAAQPLVRASYERPAETFATNVLGTSNLLEAVRHQDSVRACLIITTDKCYENREADRAYRESDRLGGRDPYSASKACAELVVSAYRDSFFSGAAAKGRAVSVSSARAGNVIGGGDWARDRLVPDCIRALEAGRPISVRNPRSVRPWQFVLEPLSGYLSLAAHQLAASGSGAEAWNFGPPSGEERTAAQIAELVVRGWGSGRWTAADDSAAPHEAGLLKLDSSKARERLSWRPVYGVDEAVARTVAWYRAAAAPGFDALAFTRGQIADYAEAARRTGLPWAGERAASGLS